MFKKLKKKFSKNTPVAEKERPPPPPPASASASRDPFALASGGAPPPPSRATAAAQETKPKSSKLSERLRGISIKSKSVKRGGERSARVLTQPKEDLLGGESASAKEAASPTLPSFAATSQATPPSPAGAGMGGAFGSYENFQWEDFGAAAAVTAGPATSAPTGVAATSKLAAVEKEEEKAPSPKFISPIEEARRKWEAANALRPPSFRVMEEDETPRPPPHPVHQYQQQQQQRSPVSPSVSDTSSSKDFYPPHSHRSSSRDFAFEREKSFTRDDGWSDAPNSPLLLREAPSRNVSNTSVNRPPSQRLYQVVHDFMAEAGSEGELTVWIGDIVEVCREEDGWFFAKVFNEDGTLEEGFIPASHCIEWCEDGGSSRSASPLGLSPRVSPRNSIRSIAVEDILAARRVEEEGEGGHEAEKEEAEACLEICEEVHAKFSGNVLEAFGIRGAVLPTPSFLASDEACDRPVAFAVLPEGQQQQQQGACSSEETLRKATFYVNNALVGGAQVKRGDGAMSLELGAETWQRFKEKGAAAAAAAAAAASQPPRPLIAYSVHRDCFASKVPLVAQISWTGKDGHFQVMVALEASPVLQRPLEGVVVTVSGLPAVAREDSLACSPHAEVCFASREMRWGGSGASAAPASQRLRPGQRATFIATYEYSQPPTEPLEGSGASEAFPLKAHVQFHSSRAISGLALGDCGDLPVQSRMKSGEYYCTSEYRRLPLPPQQE
mmetsp:Transcript_3499/g.8792  ORF Transcript_3499/g.8792 Transcript_3499/m.8792 type:complete len:725 (-) Transcript_3499:74-2248(-)